jgi:hypothetical protein
MIEDSLTVESAGGGLLIVRYKQLWSDGEDMGGEFVCEASAASWLADRIQDAADLWSVPDIEQAMPPDHFHVFQRGGEHGEDVNVHVQNWRDPTAPRGKDYVLGGMTPETARKLAADLRTINP